MMKSVVKICTRRLGLDYTGLELYHLKILLFLPSKTFLSYQGWDSSCANDRLVQLRLKEMDRVGLV